MDNEIVKVQLSISNSLSSAALIAFNTFIKNEVSGVALTPTQKTALKTKMIESMESVEDAVTAALIELNK